MPMRQLLLHQTYSKIIPTRLQPLQTNITSWSQRKDGRNKRTSKSGHQAPAQKNASITQRYPIHHQVQKIQSNNHPNRQPRNQATSPPSSYFLSLRLLLHPKGRLRLHSHPLHERHQARRKTPPSSRQARCASGHNRSAEEQAQTPPR